MKSSLPTIFWGALIVGVIITMMFSIMLSAENSRYHSLLTAMLAVILATAFFLIIELDYPFTGELSAKPTSYMKMLQAIEMK